MSYDNNLSGILRKNDKQGNEQRPDYKGSVEIDGQKYWLSAWIRTGKDGTKLAGEKYMSLKLEAADQQQASANQQRQVNTRRSAPVQKFPDDEIPF